MLIIIIIIIISINYIQVEKKKLVWQMHENFNTLVLFNLTKVTVYLWGCLASKRYSAVGINCRQLKPYIKLKLIELAFNL